jgi:hypothetical protein
MAVAIMMTRLLVLLLHTFLHESDVIITGIFQVRMAFTG